MAMTFARGIPGSARVTSRHPNGLLPLAPDRRLEFQRYNDEPD
jgi:hypothetical protein